MGEKAYPQSGRCSSSAPDRSRGMGGAMEGAAAAVGRQRIRVLVADDHPVVRAGLAVVLGQQPDLEVVGEAEDGERAVALSLERHPDVVVMDLRLPGVDGFAATHAITRALPESRVLVLSSYGSGSEIQRALRAGARGYLLKDMVLTQVVGAVRAVHEGRRVMPAPVAERLAEYLVEPALTERELEVLAQVARGLGNREIAGAIGRSEETVKMHLKNIFAKLEVSDRTGAVTAALARGLIRLDP